MCVCVSFRAFEDARLEPKKKNTEEKAGNRFDIERSTGSRSFYFEMII